MKGKYTCTCVCHSKKEKYRKPKEVQVALHCCLVKCIYGYTCIQRNNLFKQLQTIATKSVPDGTCEVFKSLYYISQ